MHGADDHAGGNDRDKTLKITSTKLYVPISLYQLKIM